MYLLPNTLFAHSTLVLKKLFPRAQVKVVPFSLILIGPLWMTKADILPRSTLITLGLKMFCMQIFLACPM